MDINDNEVFRLENDPEHEGLFVRALLFVCIIIFIILGHWIIETSPPEPQWWIEFEKAIGVTW